MALRFPKNVKAVDVRLLPSLRVLDEAIEEVAEGSLSPTDLVDTTQRIEALEVKTSGISTDGTNLSLDTVRGGLVGVSPQGEEADYSISLNNLPEYRYGGVTGYSLKSTMSAHTGRGWTWGVTGQTPVASLTNTGVLEVDSRVKTPYAKLGLSEINASTIEIGKFKTADGSSILDFHASASRVDYNSRIVRWGGVDGRFDLKNRGSGGITIDSGSGQTNVSARLIAESGAVLGDDPSAPTIKQKVVFGTLPSSQGTTTTVPLGFDASRVHSVSLMVQHRTSGFVPAPYVNGSGYNATWSLGGTSLIVWAVAGESANILNKGFRALITYEV